MLNREEMLRRLKAGEDPLELSIEKWQDIVDGKGRDRGIHNCALCETNVSCNVCAVRIVSGYTCAHTPYGKYQVASRKERKQCAKAELEFLKSLRKEALKRG